MMPHWLAVALLRPVHRGGKPMIVFYWRTLRSKLWQR